MAKKCTVSTVSRLPPRILWVRRFLLPTVLPIRDRRRTESGGAAAADGGHGTLETHDRDSP